MSRSAELCVLVFRTVLELLTTVSCVCINHSISIRPGPLQPASAILRPSASNDEGMQPPAAFDEDYHKNHSQLQFYQFGPDRVRNMIFLKGHTLTVSSETFLSAFAKWQGIRRAIQAKTIRPHRPFIPE